MSTNGHKTTPKAKPPRSKPTALFLLGTDGELYACCPWPEGVPSLADGAQALLAIRLDETERALALDEIHSSGVVSAARTLAGIKRRGHA